MPLTPEIREGPARVEEDLATNLSPTVGDNTPDNAPVPLQSLERADFETDKFARLIHQHGKRLIWRKAMLCTCRTAESDQPKVNCTSCAASGMRYEDPLPIRGLMMQQDKSTKIFEKFGMWENGLAQVTVEPQYRLAFRDSLEMRDALSSYAESFVKGNRRGRLSKLPKGEDAVRYKLRFVTRMMGLVGGKDFIFEKDVHYTITPRGRILWTPEGNRVIPDGTYVSIRYDFRPVYLVTHMPHAIRDDVTGTKVPQATHRSLPLQAGIQLDWLNDEIANRESDDVLFTPTTGRA